MRFLLVFALSLSPIAASESRALAGDDLLAAGQSGDVYTIDSTTGQGQLINGARHYRDLACLGKRADGVMYAASADALITIDEFTGNTTFMATIGIDYVRGLAFSPDGTMYAIDDGGIAMPDVLYTIDPTTGATTLVGVMSHARIQGFAISNAGGAYAWDTEAGLLSVDLATGATSDVNSRLDGSRDIESLTFSAAGDLYGCSYYLFNVDANSGDRTPIGFGGYAGVRGLAFIGAANGHALAVTGRCPGQLTVEWSGATAGRLQALVIGGRRGAFMVPPGQVCAGTTLGVAGQVQIVSPPGPFSTGDGSGSISGKAGTSACGRYLQLIEAGSCALSNVAEIR